MNARGCAQYVRACIYLTNLIVDHAFADGFNSWNHLFISFSIVVSVTEMRVDSLMQYCKCMRLCWSSSKFLER
jgi:hypothetical protein